MRRCGMAGGRICNSPCESDDADNVRDDRRIGALGDMDPSRNCSCGAFSDASELSHRLCSAERVRRADRTTRAVAGETGATASSKTISSPLEKDPFNSLMKEEKGESSDMFF